MQTPFSADPPLLREGYAPVDHARIYFREIGRGHPIIILHGGPTFDHNYLLPEMDRLSGSFRLIYYDQRGRGRSGEDVQPDQVTLQSEMGDLESLMAYFGLEQAALLGHSWGGLLAMEYATRYPQRVSHLILIDSAPASHADFLLFDHEYSQSAAEDVEKKEALSSTAEYEAGDLEADAEYYRYHFRTTVRKPEHLERVVKSLRKNVTPEGIRRARAILQRLYDETWRLSEYNLLPRLNQLTIPTLILHGDYDFVPLECAAHIAQAIPGARLVVLNDCGHFSYIECPEAVDQEITGFFVQP